jgi:heme exporter protein C
MRTETKNDFLFISLGGILLITLLVYWLFAIVAAPPDAQQGMVYKIIFAHVPAASVALGLTGIGLLISSIRGLIKSEESVLISSQAWVEVGLVFTVITLITGSIWGKPTWGTWWTWDARLTTTLLLAILCATYLIIKSSLAPGRQRVRICSVLGIVIVVDIPIIYKSVEWWRTLHQPASLIAERGRTMDPDMLKILIVALVLTNALAIYLWMLRRGNLKLKADIELASYEGMRG